MIDVCICTYGPRPEILRRTLAALAAQTAGPRAFRILVVDNGNAPALSEEILSPVRAAGIEARLVREERLGLTVARLRAIAETRGDWLLFLDDDNEVRADFIQEGRDFIAARPEVGCFGGKLLLPEGMVLPRWVRDFVPYLAIKDAGDEVVVGRSREWGVWEPPGAGAWVRREVADSFRRRYGGDPRILELGRRGKKILASCEDSVMMREAVRLDLLHAYNPRLVLHHHVDPTRFRAGYLVRLLHAYGSSHVLVETLVKGRPELPRYAKYYRNPWKFWMLILAQLWRARKTSAAFAVAMAAYHWGARATFAKATVQGGARPSRSPRPSLAVLPAHLVERQSVSRVEP